MRQRFRSSLWGALIIVVVAVAVDAIGSAPILLPAVLYDSGASLQVH